MAIFSKTETPDHTIYRGSTWFTNSPQTRVVDKDTGASSGTQVGRTQNEADQRAWDHLHSANESKRK